MSRGLDPILASPFNSNCTKNEVEVSYDVSNEFFRLWLDEHMHYTSASFLTGDETLEKAQLQKCKILADYAEMTPDKTVLDIGCGWGSNLEYLALERKVKSAHGITLSTEQHREIMSRKLPGVNAIVCDYKDFEPSKLGIEKYDALISIEMIDHLCSPEQANKGMAIEIYREYFRKTAEWVKPGAHFGFQAILRNRVPRTRKDLEERIDRMIEELAARHANLAVTSGRQAVAEAADALETRGIVVLERGRFRVRERNVLRFYARSIEHLLVTSGRPH